MTFEELENRYYVLKGKHSAGLLSDEEFQAAVDKLTLQDSEGRWWMIGAKSGKWYLSREGEWVEAEPPGAERVCPQCGAPMEEGALFCGSCSYRLVEKPAPPPYVPPPPPTPKPTVTTTPPVAKRPHRGLLIGVIGLLFLCFLSSAALGAYEYLSPTKPLSTRLMGLLRRPTSGLGPTATPPNLGLEPAAIPTITGTARAAPAPTSTPTASPTSTPMPVGGTVSITATSTELMVGEVVTVRVTLHNTGPVMVGQPQFSLLCEYEDDSAVLEPARAEPVVHPLAVEPGETDMAEFVFEALRPGKVTLQASVNFEFQVGPEVGYEGTPFWQWSTLSSEEALEISVAEAEAEYLRILAVDVPDQVIAGELFVVTIRYAWSFQDQGTVGIRAEGGGGYQGMPGSPTEVTGEGEFTHGLPVLAPDTPGPHTFVVEAYGYSVTSPNLTDQWETTVNVTAPGGQVELGAETAQAILPSADELGVDQLAFMETVIADQGEGYGDLTDYRVFDSDQTKIVDLIVFANPDDAGRFTAQLFYDYQGMGDTPVWIDLGDQSFARQGEVWVRVERYILWALGEVDRDQLSPSVQRLQAFVGGGP